MAKSSTFNVSLKLLTQQFNAGLKNIQKQIRGVGNFIKGAFALGSITAFGRQMIQTAMEFEDAMSRVKAVSNASTRELQMMTEEARRLGATTRYTATEAAGALENLTRNGMSASQATQALGGTLKFAQANSIGLAESADIVSNTLNMFGMTAGETEKVADVLSATASNSATNVSLLYEALVNAAPAAKVLGIGLDETSAAIGALAQRGVKGANAGTQLRMALTKMVDPKIVAKMNGMGVAIDEETIKTEGLIGAVKRLHDANLSLSQLVEIFSQRGAVGVQQLIGAYEEFELMLEVTKNSAGTTARMFEQGVGSTKSAIDTLKSTYESFLISMGEKTSGVVNGAIKYLTKLIKNFDTVGGTIMNIASVIVPLFTKRVVTMFTVFSTGAKKAIVDAVALKAAMGDWITLIATVVTWVGTYLYTSLSKVNKELRTNKGELEKVTLEMNSLKGKVDNLISTLGPETNTKTLAGVVSKLTGLFPDFKDEIVATAAEAGKTGNYDKLKRLLGDIIDLQQRLRANKYIDEIVTGYEQSVVNQLNKRANSAGSVEHALERAVKQAMDKAYPNQKKLAKQQTDNTLNYIYGAIFEAVRNNTDTQEAHKELVNALNSVYGDFEKEFNFNTGALLSTVEFVSSLEAVKEARKYANQREKNQDIINNAETEIARQTELRAAKAKADSYGIKYDENSTLEDIQAKIEKHERALLNTTTQTESAADKQKKLQDKLNEIQDEYNTSLKNSESDVIEGFIEVADCLQEFATAAKRAYDSYRDATGKTGSDNPYYEDRKKAEQRLKDRAKDADTFNQLSNISKNNVLKYPKQPGLMGERPTSMPEEKGPNFADYFKQATEYADVFISSLQTVENAWDRLGDGEASALDKLAAGLQIIQGTTSAIEGLAEMFKFLNLSELASAKIHDWVTKKKLKNDKKQVLADTAKSVTGAAASQSGIPVVGPVLAVAAVASILGLIAASAPKFAKGGIITGGSTHGDKNIARVNAGEMILNKAQQKRLFDIANGRTGNSAGQVEFFISGKDLKGVLRNIDNANSRISGARGL